MPKLTTIGASASLLLSAMSMAGCTSEARQIVSDQPQTAPNRPGDPREKHYADNYYQISQGARYFSWYGCAQCHAAFTTGGRDQLQPELRSATLLSDIYRAIVTHPDKRYDERVPTEQLWQLASFIHDLTQNDGAKNRRATLDQRGEPRGPAWAGPLK